MCFIIVSFRNFRALNFRWNFSIFDEWVFRFHLLSRRLNYPYLKDLLLQSSRRCTWFIHPYTYSTYSLLCLFLRQILFILVYISLPLNCATRAIRENHTVLSISADASLTDHDFFHILFFLIPYFNPETTFPRSERNELTRGWPSLSDAKYWSLTQLVSLFGPKYVDSLLNRLF